MASTATTYDSDCVLMLPCEGSDLGTSFPDSSFSNTKTVTANGGAVTSTTLPKFGSASALFVSATTSYLTVPDSTDWDFGTGDFTIDFWLNWTTVATAVLIDRNNSGEFGIRYGADGKLKVEIETDEVVAFSWSPSTATWYHIAVTRNGSDVDLFIDGTVVATNTTVRDIQGATGIAIGATTGGGSPANVKKDEIRIVKGTAVWTANFTPPSAAYTRAANAKPSRMMLMGIG